LAQPFSFGANIAGRQLTIESGKLAGQADAAVSVRYGDTVALVNGLHQPPST